MIKVTLQYVMNSRCEKFPFTDFRRGWVGFGVDVDALEKSLPHRASNPVLPSP